MKYFSVVRALKLGSTIVPGLDGKNVKNKNDFFGLEQKACGPNRFYDKNYEFDYLVPNDFGDTVPKTEPQIIVDYHTWHGESPLGAWLMPISKKYKELLERYCLPDSRFYSAKVLFNEVSYDYFVWQLLYDSYLEFIDFEKTIFNNLNNFRKLKYPPLATKTFLSIEEVKQYAKNNWNRKWNFEKVVMKNSFKSLDICTLPKIGEVISERLKIAIEEAGITGVEFEELPVPIEFSDEV